MAVLKLEYGRHLYICLQMMLLLYNGVDSATISSTVSATTANGTLLTSKPSSITVLMPAAISTLTVGLASTEPATGNPTPPLTTSKSSKAYLNSTYNSTMQLTNSPLVNPTINSTMSKSLENATGNTTTKTSMSPQNSSASLITATESTTMSPSTVRPTPSSTTATSIVSTLATMSTPAESPGSNITTTTMSISSSTENQTVYSNRTTMSPSTVRPTTSSTTATSIMSTLATMSTPIESSTLNINTATMSTPTESSTLNISTTSMSTPTESPASNIATTSMSTSTESSTLNIITTTMSTPTESPTSNITTTIMSTPTESPTSNITTATMSTPTESPTSNITTATMSTPTESSTSTESSTLNITTTSMLTPTESPGSNITTSTMSTSTESSTLNITTTSMSTPTENPTSNITTTTMSTPTESPTSNITTTSMSTPTESPTSNITTTTMSTPTENPTSNITTTTMSTPTESPTSNITTTIMSTPTENPTPNIATTLMSTPTESPTSNKTTTTMSTSTTDLTLNSTTASFNSSISSIGMNTTDEYINMTSVEPSTREESSTLYLSSTQINTTLKAPTTTLLNETQTSETTTETTIITTDYQTTMTENDTTSNEPSTTTTNVIVTRTSTAAVPTTEKPLYIFGGPYPSFPFRDSEYSYYEIQVVASKNQTVNFVWSLNGSDVNKGQSFSRIHAVDNRNETRFISRLIFNRTSFKRDNGSFIRYKVNSYWYPISGPWVLYVIPQPSIDVYPRSPSIQNGSYINVTCNYTNYVAINASDSIQWLLNGKSYNVQGNIVNGDVWVASIITVSTKGNYTCKPSGNCTSCANYSIVGVYEKEITPCLSSENWPTTAPGSIQLRPCPEGFTGEMSRKCEILANGSGGWKSENKFKCIRQDIQEIFEKIDDIIGENVTDVLDSSLDKINNVTKQTSGLSSGDLYKTVDVLDKIINIGDQTNTTVDEKVFGDIIGNLISDSADNKKNWDEVNQVSKSGGASRILKTVTTFGKVLGKQLQSGQQTNITNDNMVLQVEKSKPKLIDFKPEGSSRLEFPKGNFEEQDKDILIITAFYDKIGAILPNSGQNNGSVVASPVMSLSIDGFENKTLKWPLTLTLSNQDVNITQPKTDCVFWDFRNHKWNSYGCTYNQLKSKNNISVCECTHLTNFAILMSQGDETISEEDMKRLKIISDIGCSISILGLILTMIVYARVWRHVKNERSILLMNLCTALTIAYILFISAVDRDVEEIPCTIITACLHYIFLVVFFIMLAEGVDILIAVVIVFRKSSKMKVLLMMSWGFPLIIVGITLGLTRDKEYFTPHYCWLTIKGGVLFAFVGPVFFVILANIIIIIITLRALFSTHSMKSKKRKEKAVSGVRSICTLLPILGITWLFGLLTVNDDSVIFQYLFAVTNSLQGFFIFIFHCVLNRAVQKAMRHIIQRHDLYQFRTKESFLKLQRTKSSESYDTQDKNNEKVSQRKYSDNGSMMNSFQMSSIPFPRTKSSESYDTPDKNNEKVLQRQYSDNGSTMTLFQMPSISLPRKESWSYS